MSDDYVDPDAECQACGSTAEVGSDADPCRECGDVICHECEAAQQHNCGETAKAAPVFHALTYTGRKPVLDADADKPHRCPACWSVLYDSSGTPATVLPLNEVRECWHCGAYVGPQPPKVVRPAPKPRTDRSLPRSSRYGAW